MASPVVREMSSAANVQGKRAWDFDVQSTALKRLKFRLAQTTSD
jgi:hypothetical protein